MAQVWADIFDANERAKPSARLTDEQITEAMRAAFPNRQSKVFTTVQKVRGRYNAGILTGKRPRRKSYRYLHLTDGRVLKQVPKAEIPRKISEIVRDFNWDMLQ